LTHSNSYPSIVTFVYCSCRTYCNACCLFHEFLEENKNAKLKGKNFDTLANSVSVLTTCDLKLAK